MLVEEIKKKNQSVYVIDEEPQRTVVFDTAISNKNNRTYYFIYDDQNNITEYSYYLTYHFGKTARASKEQALYALRLLAIFCCIICVNLRQFTPLEVKQLVEFLRGEDYETERYEFSFVTKRSNETVNCYMSIYREYIRHLGISKHPLLDVDGRRIGKSGEIPANERYSYTLKTNKVLQLVPEYIHPNEFIRIIKENDLNKDELIVIRNKVMLYLMYQYGLRLGEVLALTTEDIRTEEIPIYNTQEVNELTGEVSCEYKEVCILTLRNRRFQEKGRGCKGLTPVDNIKTYQSREYMTKKLGFDEVVVNLSMYELIEEYRMGSMLRYKKDEYRKYTQNTEADSVTYYQLSAPMRKEVDKSKNGKKKYSNRYLMLNSKGGRLSAQSWSKELKNLYLNAGIPIDTEKKEVGLSHRLRHGFAMNEIKFNEQVIVSQKLRHRSIRSIEAYYHQDPESLIEMKNEIASFDTLLGEDELRAIEKYRKGEE